MIDTTTDGARGKSAERQGAERQGAELRGAKRLALAFFGVAASLFLLSLLLARVLPPSWWIGLVRAFAEAAMVGALADWFAVVALFRKVPIPFVQRHTNIIPANQERIAANLSVFVREKFLDTGSLVALLRRHDPAQWIAGLLVVPANAERLGKYTVRVLGSVIDFIDDAPVQQLVRRAVHTMIEGVDLSQTAGSILDSVTRNGRHQALLDEGLTQLAQLLANEETQAAIAQGIGDWLREEYAFMEAVLPTELIGRKGAAMVVKIGAGILGRVSRDPNHPLRQRFDAFSHEFIERLKHDPDFIEKGEQVKRYLIGDETLNAYLGALWGDVKGWIKADLARADSTLHARIVAAGGWIGRMLAEDAALRASLNAHLEEFVGAAAPGFSGFLTDHIADTVRKWDKDTLASQVELNIGKDLQYIRINGTVVGGLIGVVLYALSTLPWLSP
jgi:uncharacterized membrane-anchored protein YjiN (DUF445 family)